MKAALFRRALYVAFAPLPVLLASLPLAAQPVQGHLVQLVPLATGLTSPVGIVNAGDGSNRLFLVQQTGAIRIWDGTRVLASPFLDISALVSCDPVNGCGERGLLGLAFHPDYESNGFFYVYYTRRDDTSTATDENGDIVIARYQVSAANPDAAAPGSALTLLTIEHSSRGNHNGGQLAFGPNDSYLYISTGDGGGGGDPFENGQDLNSPLGKILRLDVNSGTPYSIPASNPFAGPVAGLDEIWAYGLRNPWRFSFDRSTGDLYIGDVGQNTFEEIDFQPADSAGGENYGWDCREGAHPYSDQDDVVNMPPVFNSNCAGRTFRDPILEYGRTAGCSVTGGFVFRNLPSHLYYGQYFYGDFCSGRIWRGIPDGSGGWTSEQLSSSSSVPALFGITSFGEGESGRIYVTYSGGDLRWLAPYTFQDVPPTHAAWADVEAIAASGISRGCNTAPRYCPGSAVTRAEMAVFLVRAIRGPSFTPPPASGIFADVPAGYWAAPWIEQLHADGITQGCLSSPLRFCPGATLTRAEMAIFLLRARNGTAFTPPPANGTVFADVPASHWAGAWIEQLYTEGVTAGCAESPLRYCPGAFVLRSQMASFLTRAFHLARP